MSKKPQRADRERWARLRFAIVGPLLAAPPKPGQLLTALRELAAKHWQHPDRGEPVHFGLSTIRRWYYAARKVNDPVAVLKRRQRSDSGGHRVLPASLRAAIAAQYQLRPNWSCQLHFDNLRAVDDLPQPFPSYATLARYMRAQGLLKQHRPSRAASAFAAAAQLQPREVRSYEVEHVNSMWHLDFHDGSRNVLTREGRFVTPRLLGVLDDHSRLACHGQWYMDVGTESLVHGFSQALQKRNLPRALMTDCGSAMIAEEFVCGLHELGILHHTTLPYTPETNAKQERFWGVVEGRLMAMLEGVEELTLDYLNEATQAWIEIEYNRRIHEELGCSPLERFMSAPNVGRPCPDSDTLRRAFRRKLKRTQRRSDGTVRLEGTRLEIPARYRHLQHVWLRYARWDLRLVDLIDESSGKVLCALYPLDKAANASAVRRPLDALSQPPSPAPTGGGPAPLLKKLMAEYSATGLPPAYIPTTDSEETP
jgi:transposase InsO family protein